MNGTLAVARYTLLELSRRRILLVFFIIGALGIAAIGHRLEGLQPALCRAEHSSGGARQRPAGPREINRFLELHVRDSTCSARSASSRF